MNQSNADLDDQLQQRSKELDEREAYVISREELLTSIETSITKGQHDLNLLDTTIVAREDIISDQKNRIELLEKDYARKQSMIETALVKKQESYTKWENKLEDIRAMVNAEKESIADRDKYYKQQEELIKKQAEEGNAMLKGYEYEIVEAKHVIKDLEIKKNNLYSECKNLDSDIAIARESFVVEIDKHKDDIATLFTKKKAVESEITDISATLYELNKQVNAQNIVRQQINDDISSKLQILDTKEREIMAKREALRQEREEMEDVKHYYKDPKSLYGGTI